MTDITTQQAYARPISQTERRADALAELRQLHAEFEALKSRSVEEQRLIVHLNDRNQLLLEQLRTSQQNERVVTRKLMRLAQSVANIGSLTKDAEAIMKSAQEYEEDEAEQEATVEHPPQIDDHSKEHEEEACAATELADRIGALPPTWKN